MSEKTEIEENAKIQLTSVRNQYISAITANLVIVGYGAFVGWVSPALEKLGSTETLLVTGPLTNADKSWLGSINCLGALPGSICFGYIITKIGSKRTVLFLCYPCLICWALIYFGNTYYHIFIGACSG